MSKSVTQKLRYGAEAKSPTALDILRNGSRKAPIWTGKRRFDLSALNGATLIEVFDAVAAASGGLLLGFNRSGTMNMVLYLEGDKESYTVNNDEEFNAVCRIITDALWDFAAEKYPDVRMEVSGQSPEAAPKGG